MNEYTFQEIQMGDVVTFPYDINQEAMTKFLEITGDTNPLHQDLEYALEKGYPEIVVYGMLTSAVLSKLAGVKLPGKYSLIHSVEIHFLKPVFLSHCPLMVEAKVMDKDERFQQITVKYSIFDNTNEKVVRGTMKIGVTK